MSMALYVHPGTGEVVEEGSRPDPLAGHAISGSEGAALEQAFADFVGVRYAVSLSSGSAALHLALLAHGVKPGDGVVVSPLSPPAIIAAILATRAHPVYTDINQYTYTIDPLAVERLFCRTAAVHGSGFLVPDSPPGGGERENSFPFTTQNAARRTQNESHRVAALVATDLFGQSCDLTALADIALRHNLALIEVAWESLGARRTAGLVGGGGTSVYSFQRGMAICTGEGGMLATDDARVAEEVRLLANSGCDCHGRLHGPGFNYRMPEMVAGMALAQLPRVAGRIALQQWRAEALSHALAGIPGLVPPMPQPGAAHTFQRYALRVTPEFPLSVTEVYRRLVEGGIRAKQCHLLPPHRHPCLHASGENAAALYHAEAVARELVFLPLRPDTTDDEVQRMVRALKLMATERGEG